MNIMTLNYMYKSEIKICSDQHVSRINSTAGCQPLSPSSLLLCGLFCIRERVLQLGRLKNRKIV